MHYWTRSDGRYYATFITQDLFGCWTVIKIWGGKGKSGSAMECVPCADIDTAMQITAAVARVRLAHGYTKQDALFQPQYDISAVNEQCSSASC